MDFFSSPPLPSEPVLHEPQYSVHDSGHNMSLMQDFMIEPSTATSNPFHHVPSPPKSESSQSQYWKASLHAPPGREGKTPYLHLNDFESAEDLLNPDNEQVDTATLFTSLQESVHWRSQQVVENQPERDDTIPRSQLQKQACVKLLFKAWKSTASATDNPGMKKPFDEERHDNARVECLCWTLLEALIRRSEWGPLLVAYDPTKSKDNPAINSFAVRLDEAVISLREQKTICKHLFDAPYINTFVDDPVRARDRVASNRDLNQKKGHTMSLGKLHKDAERRNTRTKGKKRPMSTSLDAYLSDELNAMHSHSSAFQHGAPTRPACHSRGRNKASTRDSSQYTPTSMQSSHGHSDFYSGSPADLHVNARVPLISHPTSSTLASGLTRPNIQSSSSLSAVQPPSSTLLELPPSWLGNYDTMMGQTLPTAYTLHTPTVAHSPPLGFGEQVTTSIYRAPSLIGNQSIQFQFRSQPNAPTSTPRQTDAQSP